MSETQLFRTPAECVKVDQQVWQQHVKGFRARMLARLDEARDDSKEHRRLFAYVVRLDPRDWDDYGFLDRWSEAYEGSSADCSCGCKFYRPLEGDLGQDWGTCTNPASHRNGLLTFEHQGCPQFEDVASA